MEKHEYKIGDKVRIVGNKTADDEHGIEHFFQPDEIVEVTHVFQDGGLICRGAAEGEKLPLQQYCCPWYVEIVKEG